MDSRSSAIVRHLLEDSFGVELDKLRSEAGTLSVTGSLLIQSIGSNVI